MEHLLLLVMQWYLSIPQISNKKVHQDIVSQLGNAIPILYIISIISNQPTYKIPQHD